MCTEAKLRAAQHHDEDRKVPCLLVDVVDAVDWQRDVSFLADADALPCGGG